jgi:hypothetical protein
LVLASPCRTAFWSPDGKKIPAGRFGPDLLLDRATVKPVSNLKEATVLASASGLFCSAWTAGPAGNLAACHAGVLRRTTPGGGETRTKSGR